MIIGTQTGTPYVADSGQYTKPQVDLSFVAYNRNEADYQDLLDELIKKIAQLRENLVSQVGPPPRRRRK